MTHLRWLKGLCVLICILLVTNCAGGPDTASKSSEDDGQDLLSNLQGGKSQNDDPSQTQNDVVMTFRFSLTIYPENTADFGDEIHVVIDRDFELPMTLSENGKLSFYAPDFPTIVYRICSGESTNEDCDLVSDIEGLVDMDLVFDSCDRLVREHSECGSSDDTLYEGEIDSDGNLDFENIAIRTRLFFVTTTGSNGYTATATMAGSIDDLSRISLDLTTNPVTTTTGVYEGQGNANTGEIEVYGYGTIPDRSIGDMPALGVSSFVTQIDGSFDVNPFDLLTQP